MKLLDTVRQILQVLVIKTSVHPERNGRGRMSEQSSHGFD
jgi:hypothetical protein